MNNLVIRLTLVIPFLDELIVGGWNQLAPRSCYDDFPTVDLNPPFSDHFAHDFGGATLPSARSCQPSCGTAGRKRAPRRPDRPGRSFR
ncbi:hypothetical protein LWP59_24815 [Amycolatopsis acidiphila]|uniref:Uncharacterized protein n=1 Tax=Amycolatopsis acidiphila TaxID=715473 RepID=A0A558ACF3_9PSEU|nr:hypothetical protein [Amycolatopsis acidiphila]TVT21944.1 hypothetical protein FNH06_15435 [Amycolatopsis acidiphila]UIJ57368.1 hypothetical protein LWP59_24815 [Amycolatopsis acidiphila]GHG84582.1 hypothetical protein GCM10017788_56770 [Amycolatopsis acidiphila]